MPTDLVRKPTEEDLTRLRLFQERVKELRQCVEGVDQVRLSVNLQVGKPVATDEQLFSGLNINVFRSLMATIRQFTLDQDQVHFQSICKIIKRKCGRPELEQWVDCAKKLVRIQTGQDSLILLAAVG